MIPLHAAEMATRAVPEKHPDIHASHYRLLDDLTVSSLGFGTRLGVTADALAAYFRLGGNVIDAAIVDGDGENECAVGEGLARELSTGRLSRREVVVSTKGGFFTKRMREEYLTEGLVNPDDIVGGMHSLAPKLLRHQLHQSRQNLQLETIDLYYLHNPETQASYIQRGEMMARIARAIEFLEEVASDGFIRRYGISTWSGFRVASDEPDHLELAELVRMAEGVAGAQHHFRAIQVPYNCGMPGVAFSMTQEVYGNKMSVLEAAHELGIEVIVASPLMQGALASDLPPAFHRAFPRFSVDSQRALDFVVSTPWVTCAMVGMREIAHIQQNMHILRDPALTSLQWAAEVDQLSD